MKALLIFNPAAGRRNRRDEIADVINYLAEQNWVVQLRETTAAGDAFGLAREAVSRHCDAVIVAAGDGTINETINGLAESKVALGVLPTGTTNVWALEMGIPVRKGIRAAAKTLVTGVTQRVDLGLAGNRYFLLAAGIGFDGLVAERLVGIKRRSGNLDYIATALSHIWSYQGTEVTVNIDGKTLHREVFWIVVGNLRLYGGILYIAARARLDDGLMDVVLFDGRSPLSSAICLAYLASGGRVRVPNVEYYQGREVEIRSRYPMPVHLDAEFVGTTPLVVRAAPQALSVIVPSKRPSAAT